MATIGAPEIYRSRSSTNGAYLIDLEGNEVPPDQISYDYLVRGFAQNGASVIRLNMSHISVDKLPDIYSEIKRAILRYEDGEANRQQVTILADMPGPKIRFSFSELVDVKVGDPFRVSFVGSGDPHRHTVYVDDHPLKETLESIEESRFVAAPLGENADAQLTENVFGSSSATDRHPSRVERFPQFMRKITDRVSRGATRAIIGDGEVVLEVEEVESDSLKCRVLTAKTSPLLGNKGFTLKGIDVDIPTFTSHDQELLDTLVAVEYEDFGADNWKPVLGFVALSFAQTADDVLRLRQRMESQLTRLRNGVERVRLEAPAVIAKIETSKGWRNIDYILDVADGVMVARGDLGLQMEVEEVPALQKSLIDLCTKRGRPVITATEMLKSMTHSLEPTRAEANDVFNAVEDGTDAVMTSEETAVGRYPFHTLRKMMCIAEQAELRRELDGAPARQRIEAEQRRVQEFIEEDFGRIRENELRLERIISVLTAQIEFLKGDRHIAVDRSLLDWRVELYKEKLGKAIRQESTNRISQATCTMTEMRGIDAILAASTSGRTVRMVSRLRPSMTIVGAVHDEANARKLLLSYGVIPLHIGRLEKHEGINEVFDRCRYTIERQPILAGMLRAGSHVVFTSGTGFFQTPGTTNSLQIRGF